MRYRRQLDRARRFLHRVTHTLSSSEISVSSTTSDKAEISSAACPSAHLASAERIKASGEFEIDDVALLGNTHGRFDFAPNTPWDDFRGSFLVLPKWYRFGLDPMTQEYARQQHHLWATVAGINRDYDPQIDEKEAPLLNVDAIRLPAYFSRRDPEAIEHAAKHILATGMLIKHSGLRPGQWALEYGAGFAQTALQFARLGVNVDTVDISEEFCRHVKTQADFFGVPLTPFIGRFGWNPRGDKNYDLIWFYESFHHCIDFKNVVRQLHRHLATHGSILLAGEPIRRREDRCIPYPWGLRLDSENIAVIRLRHWFEIGFTEDFLVALFTNAGFSARRMDCSVSSHGEGYIFRHRPRVIEMATHWLPTVEGESWHHPEAAGRWTREQSFLTLDATDSFTALDVEVTNYHPQETSLELEYGGVQVVEAVPARERRTFRIDAKVKADRLIFRSQARVPSRDYEPNTVDTRALGLFVNSVGYV